MIEQLQDGRVLASQSGQKNRLTVIENKLFRWLCFDDQQAIQSCMLLTEPAKLILPYQQFMMMWQLLTIEHAMPFSACLLGVGGGDMIRYLRSMLPLMKLVAVDNEPQIAEIASTHFLIQPDQQHLIIEIADAEKFIQKPAQYDLLLIDIVNNNVLPDFLSAQTFWENCHASLSDQGMLVANIIPETETGFVNLLKMLREIFGHLPLCMGVPEHKNIILLMPMSAKAVLSTDELRQRGAEIQKNSSLPFGLCTDILVKDNLLS